MHYVSKLNFELVILSTTRNEVTELATINLEFREIFRYARLEMCNIIKNIKLL